MNDDWRLRIDVHEHGLARALTGRLDATELGHDLQTSFHDRVVVTVDGADVFCYTGAREQAERAQALIERLAAEHQWRVDFELKHWHPTSETWEDPDVPLPNTDAERADERRELMDKERAETDARGYPEYEVRVECASEPACEELAEKLRAEGIPSVQRSRFLLVGATDEDAASVLAERIRGEVSEGSVVSTEASYRAVLDELPNPFALFGGLAG
jgi:hypothetical protein